jgi:hypothetical protein
MKLTSEAIKAMTVRTRTLLALEMDCSVPTVDRWIKDNEPNGDLTKASALKIIAEETGLEDSQILEEDTVKGGEVSTQS